MASIAPATESYPSPVTPQESETDESLPSAPMSSRKRSASEMAEDDADRKPIEKHYPRGMTARKKPVVDKEEKKKGKKRSTAHADQETIEAEATVDTTFLVECPAWPESKRYLARVARGEDLYTERVSPSLAGGSQLDIAFAVKPGSHWSDLQRFKNAKFKDPVEVIYSAGHIVYVNRNFPVPAAPSADASEEEKLAFDKENLWCGVVEEFRAASQEKVYVRLFWLYWPEELPMGRQPYHGKRELVLSNHVDIIEAQSIACHADISHWDENDDSNKTVLSERFWRQTYDLTKRSGSSHNALSKLRKFCVCGGYDTPELDMYQCHKVGCGMWNHHACLIADVEERAWEKFKKGQLTDELPDTEEHKSLTQKITDTVGHMVEKGLGKSEVKDEAHSESISSSGKKAKSATAGKKPWSGKLAATITKIQKSSDETIHRATVTQLVPASNSKARPSYVPQDWSVELNCLRCHQALN
ncbi:hypothetical protein H2200_001927 [Cladophialophora chaetospira]|uniref:BAH domain-containing protein n=1 Tax=Cladophialophora chaetospira TaxID=386627 RepID=A0AA39CQ53_9EURO|nr:hypothetical protein H2200_001927 [Cladophialophora chaetospira]